MRVDHGDLEFLNAWLTTESFEALDRNFRASCHKLNEFSSLTIIKVLQRLPEQQHWLGVSIIALIVGILFQIIDIDLLQARNEKLEFTIVEDFDKVFRYDLEQALFEGVHLGRDRLFEAIVGN